MIDAIINAGLPWFEANTTAEDIIDSATEFPEPWRNEQFVHVDLGHSYLRAGRLDEALRILDRKPSRVARYKSLADWIANGDTTEINKLHAQWITSARAELPTDRA
ncbi:hypothetical protein NA78x_002797 [Anatilimnocola sp. NA78]|uniref:hypothetical protein n=1 Tax=Anatilimnocola sp. NA78 TaxID=3415683 RepID=UPI003CE4ACF1